MWVESRTENLQQILAHVGDGQVPTGEANVDGSSGRCPQPDSDADADAGNDAVKAGEFGVSVDADRSLWYQAAADVDIAGDVFAVGRVRVVKLPAAVASTANDAQK